MVIFWTNQRTPTDLPLHEYSSPSNVFRAKFFRNPICEVPMRPKSSTPKRLPPSTPSNHQNSRSNPLGKTWLACWVVWYMQDILALTNTATKVGTVPFAKNKTIYPILQGYMYINIIQLLNFKLKFLMAHPHVNAPPRAVLFLKPAWDTWWNMCGRSFGETLVIDMKAWKFRRV